MGQPLAPDDSVIVARCATTGAVYFPAAYVAQLLAYIAQLEKCVAELKILAAGG